VLLGQLGFDEGEIRNIYGFLDYVTNMQDPARSNTPKMSPRPMAHSHGASSYAAPSMVRV
jgi:hypothetical protein